MTIPDNHEKGWILCTRIAGVCALLGYFAVPVFHLPPWPVGRWIFFLIGPTLALGGFAFLQACRYRREDVARTIGLWAVMISGLFMHVMAVLWGVNNVQLSLDICFDIWIAGGGFFLAAGLVLGPRRRWLGVLGFAADALALGMNIWKCPAPPAEVGGIAGGPFLAAWFGFYLWLETRAALAREKT